MFTNKQLDEVRQTLANRLGAISTGSVPLNNQQLSELLIHQLLSMGASWIIVGSDLQVHADWYMVTYPGLPDCRHPSDAIRLTFITTPGGPLMSETLRWHTADGSPDLEHLLSQTKEFLSLRHAVKCEEIVS
jgi:hypothetical protein